MATLFKGGSIMADSWQHYVTAAGSAEHVPSEGDLIVPFDIWNKNRKLFQHRNGRTGVLLEKPSQLPRLIADFDRLALIAVRVPKFSDSASREMARSLRDRYGWKGALRAVGDVRQEQLAELSRYGFDSVQSSADLDWDVNRPATDARTDLDAVQQEAFATAFQPRYVRLPTGREWS